MSDRPEERGAHAPGGVAEVSDFMPVEDARQARVVRRAKTVRGEVRFRMVCHPRFDYARQCIAPAQRAASPRIPQRLWSPECC